MPECKYCRQSHPILKDPPYCTYGCHFQHFHYSKESHSKEHADMKEWMRLNKLHLEEQRELARENKIKKYMKNNGTIEKPLLIQTFKSESSDKEYSTALYETFEICNCQGFVKQHKCWHVEELLRIYKLFN